jgi:4-diphosphocytidyl-2-C-methyl-D-erythritol kinase
LYIIYLKDHKSELAASNLFLRCRKMHEITLLTPAKINLSIDVTGCLENGYHTVEMIMQSIGLFDTVIVKKMSDGIAVNCTSPFVPNDQKNIAWKAAAAFFSKCPEKGGASITIKKKIPVAAGLAGGLTNAAGVLKALNKLYDDCFSQSELMELSMNLGADVAFCLKGGTQLARGIGNELTQLPDFEGVYVVLIKPPFPVSTPWVYKSLNMDDLGERPETTELIAAVKENDFHAVAKGMRNVLESVTIKKYPELQKIMDRFMKYGAAGSRMSGSGPTVFGLFESRRQALYAKEQFSKDYKFVYQIKTIGEGE